MNIKFKKLKDNAKVPQVGTEFSAGSDLRACIENPVTIEPGMVSIIDTGIAVEIPEGFFGMVCPRSGLSAKNGITVLNAPGIVDADYRGEVKCILINHSKTPFVVENDMRIAQLIITPFQKANWIESDDLTDSARGTGKFGSTGIF